MIQRTALFLITIIGLCSCQNETVNTPKPRAFPKVEFPQGEYQAFQLETCPFEFQYPTYSEVVRDTTFFNEDPGHPCWFDIATPSLNGRIHFSYYDINGRNDMDKLISDAFELTNKHNMKASYIEESVFRKGKDVSGVIFKMEGPVATPFQFFITDSTTHFLRAALYVQASARPDSLRPIYDFLQKDMDVMIQSFNWK